MQTDLTSIILMPPPKTKTNCFLGHKRENSEKNSTTHYFSTPSISSAFFYVPEAHNDTTNKIYDQLKKKNSSKKFVKLTAPTNDKEIKCFIKNILEYLSYIGNKYHNKNCINLKTRVEVRYEDFINEGMDRNYFIMCLMRMQNELISIICLYERNLLEEEEDNNV